MGQWGTCPPPPRSTFNDFIFSSLWSKFESQLSKYCSARLADADAYAYCINHKIISHQAAAARGPEVQVSAP